MSKKNIIITIAILFVVLIAGVGIYAYSIFSQISGERPDESQLSIKTGLDKNVVNIALFGVDGRDTVLENGEQLAGNRTDTIMIASFNTETGQIKVISVMRDLLARIPESGRPDRLFGKINSAYAYGGTQAAIQALNENFDLNIADYVTVDFNCMVDAVDALGGIDINIQNEDVLKHTNEYIWDVDEHTGHDTKSLTHTGTIHVNGVQALAYCRNRESDSDYGRTERQREVLSTIADKAMKMDLLTAINLITKIYPYIKTSLTLSEMTDYYKALMQCKDPSIDSARLPFDLIQTADNLYYLSYVIPCDLKDNVKVLHGYLYGDDHYSPSDTVLEISSRIQKQSGYGSVIDWSDTTWQDIMDNQTSVRDVQ